jgi:ABC-2 type transport system ATP-binding protein
VDVELSGVTRRVGRVTAIEGVAFRAEPGEVLGLLGPNGAGKTTTMRVLTGYLRPSAGAVRIGGLDALADPVGARRQVGYLPESVPVYPEMTVAAFLGHCARLRGVARRRRGPAVGRAMQLAG